MQYLFELSKEHPTIPFSEVFSCLKAEKIKYETKKLNSDLLIIETVNNIDKIRRIANRLSFTFCINQFLFSCPNDEIEINAEKKPIKKEGSIAVRCRNRSQNIDSEKIIKDLATVYTKNRQVILRDPDVEIRALITDNEVNVGIKKYVINRTQYEQRKVQFRPFFSPISLHPKIARALVNISQIRKNETLLDPFCGTGGILLEAGVIGAKIVGSDIENKMIVGCKKTLDHYKIKNYELECCDIGKIKNLVKKVDSIVTDLPYGKSTTTKGENMKPLYDRAFKNMAKTLKKHGIAVIGLSNKNLVSLGEQYFTHIETYEIIAHRSLIRYFAVFEK
jgi:tRNA (guanine10-N2)-dimethyltransferase